MTSLASPPSAHFLPAVWKLIRLRLLITFNGFKHAKLIRKILTIVAVLGLLAFAGMILFVSWLLLDFLRSPKLTQYVGIDVTPFLQTVPVLIFTALFLGLLLSSFGVLLQALYLSGDMDFLLSSPVPIRAVFFTKLLQAVLPNFGLIALFGLPVLFGLGLAWHYSILYFPLVVLTMIALALAAQVFLPSWSCWWHVCFPPGGPPRSLDLLVPCWLSPVRKPGIFITLSVIPLQYPVPR